MTAETEMYFGTAHVVGVEAIQGVLRQDRQTTNVTHDVLECWSTDDACFVRGEATKAKKTEPEKIVHAPFMHIYYLDETEPPHIHTIRITAGPLQTQTVL